jgi:hypothetical protein
VGAAHSNYDRLHYSAHIIYAFVRVHCIVLGLVITLGGELVQPSMCLRWVGFLLGCDGV